MDLTQLNPEQLKLYRELLIRLAPSVYYKYFDEADEEFSLQVDRDGVSEADFQIEYKELAEELAHTAYWMARKSGL